MQAQHYILSYNKIACINNSDGEIIWQQSLSKLGLKSYTGIGEIRCVDKNLIVSLDGSIACLSAKDGSLVWKNTLKGWSYYFISLAVDTSNHLYIFSNAQVAKLSKKDGSNIWHQKFAKQYSSMQGGIGEIIFNDDKLILAVNGTLTCIAEKDGNILWHNELKGWGYYPISITNAQQSMQSSIAKINAINSANAAVSAGI
jgi:outer membrane protein assembly factor BamB